MRTIIFAAISFLMFACSKSDQPIAVVKPSIDVINVEKFVNKTRFDVRVNHPELVTAIHFYYTTSVNVMPKSGSFFVNATGVNPGKFTIWAKDGSKIEIGGTW